MRLVKFTTSPSLPAAMALTPSELLQTLSLVDLLTSMTSMIYMTDFT
jgi:hypothetical protein